MIVNFTEPGSEDYDPFSLLLKQNMIDIIQWEDKRNPRSHQVLIGPSEIGDPCKRRIAYRLAQTEPCNVDFDTWPAIVGTAIHRWLETAITNWDKARGRSEWLTETTLVVNDFVEGHADLYWTEHQCVIDHKTQGPDIFRKTKKDGPAPGYVIQAQIYGYGFEMAGYPVKKVALTFFSRAGWLKDMYVWSADYDRTVAEDALQRVFDIATESVRLDVLNKSHAFNLIEATPSNSCGMCDWYNSAKQPDQGADEFGCPGR